jgi:hypothetical protein
MDDIPFPLAISGTYFQKLKTELFGEHGRLMAGLNRQVLNLIESGLECEWISKPGSHQQSYLRAALLFYTLT